MAEENDTSSSTILMLMS